MGPKHWIRERSKMCSFPSEIQQFWNMDKIKRSVNAAKIEYNLGNMHNCENRSATAKKRHSKNAYKTNRFWRKMDVEAPRPKNDTPGMLIKPIVFLRILMITKVEARLRSSKMWILARTYDKNEPPMDPNRDYAVRNCGFRCSHSKILKSAESTKSTAPQFGWRLRRPHREAKPTYPN